MSVSSLKNGARTGTAWPPPGGGWAEPDDIAEPAASARLAARPLGHPFAAELDLCEIDDRGRPGRLWSGRGVEISRAHLVFRSRRMCYPGRLILLAVHLVDDRPMPLYGRVHACEYDGDGLHRVDLDLLPIPQRPAVRDWIRAQGSGRA